MLREEMKKILTWKKLLLILAVTVLYFLLFLHPYVVIYEGSYHQEAEIAKTLTDRYGTEITAEEYEQMKQEVPFDGKELLDEIASGLPGFQERGIQDMREFLFDETLGEDEKEALWEALYEAINFVEPYEDMSETFTDVIELSYWDSYLDSYQTEALDPPASGTAYYEDLNEGQTERVQERNKREVRAVLPAQMADTNFEVLQFLAPLMVIGVILLILPYMVRENRSGMTAIQYSSPRGRRCYAVRLKAAALSILLLLLFYIGLYAVTAEINGVFDFWNTPISACTTRFISWFPWTLGQVTASAVGLACAAAFGAGIMTFVITSSCRNYITAIAAQLPLLIAGIVFGIFFLKSFTEITQDRYLAFLIGIGWLAAGVLCGLMRYWAERRRDLADQG